MLLEKRSCWTLLQLAWIDIDVENDRTDSLEDPTTSDSDNGAEGYLMEPLDRVGLWETERD